VAGTVAWIEVADTNVVTSDLPSNAASEPWTNPVPVIVTAVSEAPTVTDDGVRDATVGTGLGAGLLTVMLAVPDFVSSCWLVAVTVAVPLPLAGAVYLPVEPILPRFVDQVTAELKLPVP
jgi:hypothetical protein